MSGVEPPQSDLHRPSQDWYGLFSRGSRDWLRHNEKIREAVREQLPDIVANGDVLGHDARTVRVPVRLIEHHHFRLREDSERSGVGQGRAKPGDAGGIPQPRGSGNDRGEGGRDQGGVELQLEFRIDDIVDWFWEEMRLPNLLPRDGPSEEADWIREGLDRRGARSRLDRRRSLKESVRRRTQSPGSPVFTDDDLRFRQLARRPRPATRAAVFFLLDVSGSVSDRERQLAKTFFFWVVQGLRRQYRSLDTVFVAHTTEAWEFDEPEFFRVSGSGGTVASTGFGTAATIASSRFDPASTNVYVFYASDGDNAVDDRGEATRTLAELARLCRYVGYLEVSSIFPRHLRTEMGVIFSQLARGGAGAGSFMVSDPSEIWAAVRHFFHADA